MAVAHLPDPCPCGDRAGVSRYFDVKCIFPYLGLYLSGVGSHWRQLVLSIAFLEISMAARVWLDSCHRSGIFAFQIYKVCRKIWIAKKKNREDFKIVNHSQWRWIDYAWFLNFARWGKFMVCPVWRGVAQNFLNCWLLQIFFKKKLGF